MTYKFKAVQAAPYTEKHLNLGGENPNGERIDVSNKYFIRNGKPWIAVMGEFHFSRYTKADWGKEIAKMKAGGITLVSTYLFWIYHEEDEGVFNFEGDRDVRAFVEECQKQDMDVIIRIGGWAHGECRNGGFPDWLMKKPFKLRDNNEGYLEQIRKWYGEIEKQLRGLFYKDGGNIVGVQLENELVDNAEHLKKLKELAIESGIIAPLYTVTGWNSASGARIPVDEVVPVFGGYCEAPWENHTRQLEPSPHYFFNRMRNDSAIGTDLIAKETGEDDWQLPYERYPFATCELGGGIQVTHHRRPIINPMDTYAVSLIKLGDGNNLPGYYMYHGGTNKIGKYSTLNESKKTGYPNDYPLLSYDFQAPLSEYGEARAQYGMMNLLHMFVQDFGEEFAPMEAADAELMPKREDKTSLRYGMRTNGKSGYVFVNHYERLRKLENVYDVELDTGAVKFPKIDVCGEISFFMPYNMDLSGKNLEYATAQPICKDGDTYFFASIGGIKASYKLDGKIHSTEDGISTIEHDGIKIVTIPFEQARYLRRLGGKIYLGKSCDLYEYEGKIECIQDGSYEYAVWENGAFKDVKVERKFNKPETKITPIEKPDFNAKYVDEMHIGGERKIEWKRVELSTNEGFAEIDYIGDGAQLYVDGELRADDYYYGKTWRIPAKMLYGHDCVIAVSEMRDDFYKEF